VLNEDYFGNRVLFDSGKLAAGSSPVKIDIDIAGVQYLVLEFSGKESLGDWGGVRVVVPTGP
jgi:alpha-galactosidase